MTTSSPLSAIVAALLIAGAVSAQSSWFQQPDPPGPHVGLTEQDLSAVESFGSNQPIVGTYLFYWYDVYSGAHVTYGDGGDACTTHPPSWDDYSYHSTRWWLEQLRDITAAGIDFAAPVYWGYPGAYESWSFQGLPHLVRACDYMRRLDEERPSIALFYDTSTLQHNRATVSGEVVQNRRIDLSTQDGKAWFYCSIRDFFSLIPPRHWAAIDGRPIVLLYSPGFAAKQDPALFPYVRERFEQDFGVEPYIIKQTSWEGEADSTCNWGGALGLQLAGCAALGPGYDHSAVRGRQPLVRPREDGRFYSESWERLLRLAPERRPRLVMVETWNEFHEGTDVAHSAEYGRQYIELTRRYADMFHRGEQLRATGPYQGARAVEEVLAEAGGEAGIRVVEAGDGAITRREIAGRACIQSVPTEFPGRYLYFDVHDSFAYDVDAQPIRITVEYHDAGCEAFELHYDSLDADSSVRDGAFKPGGQVQIEDTGRWRTAQFEVSDARFAGRCNGADLRLAVIGSGELAVATARVEKRGED
ncbi:MAG: DUF5010 domain-containing protein [Armatimonadota bacterium]